MVFVLLVIVTVAMVVGVRDWWNPYLLSPDPKPGAAPLTGDALAEYRVWVDDQNRREMVRIYVKRIAIPLVLCVAWGWYYIYINSDSVKAADARDRASLNEVKLQRVVRGFVLARLKDPDSAQFRNQSGVCGEVNARNSLGGYVGYRRFIAPSAQLAILEGDTTPEKFNNLWQTSC